MIAGGRPGAGANKKPGKLSRNVRKKLQAKKSVRAKNSAAVKGRKGAKKGSFSAKSLSGRSANQYNSLSGSEQRRYVANRNKGMAHYESYRAAYGKNF